MSNDSSAGSTISELPVQTTVTDADLFVFDSIEQPPGQWTSQITAANLAAYFTTKVIVGSGFLARANNLSDLLSVSQARTNLGLGSAALLAAGAVAQTANNLSDLTNAATARSNLGLGSIATQGASAVAITGGAIDGTAIGQTTKAAGAFTTLVSTTGATLSAETVGAVSTWPNTYLPGIGGANAVLDYDIAPAGNFYGVRATALRSSDNSSGTPENLLNVVNLAVADHTSIAHLIWGEYNQVNVTTTGKYGILFGKESSISNQGSAATALDPFTTVQTGAIIGYRIDNGTGSASANASVALDIANNGGKFIRGIRITQDALDISSGIADALAMGPDHSLTWYKSLGAYSWRIFNNAALGQSEIILGPDTLDLFVSAANAHVLAITAANFGVGVTSSFTGTMTGPDGGTWQSGLLNVGSGIVQLSGVGTLTRNPGTGALTIATNASSLTLSPATGVIIGSASDPGAGNLAVQGSVTTPSATAGIGYSTGAGGVVSQATDKTTTVVLSKISGAITTMNTTLAASTTVSFTLTNTAIAATDSLVLNHVSGGTPGSYTLNAQCAAGSATINVRNISLGSLSEAIVIKFSVLKGANS